MLHGALMILPPTQRPGNKATHAINLSNQWTVCCDNLLLWHSDTCTIRPGIFHPPRLRGVQFVSCDMMSTLLKILTPCLSCPEVRFGQFFSHVFWTHLWCSDSFLARCGHFDTGFLKTHLWCPASFSAKCGPFVTWFLTHLWCPATCSAKCGLFVTGFDTFVCVCVCVRVHHPWISVPCALT